MKSSFAGKMSWLGPTAKMPPIQKAMTPPKAKQYSVGATAKNSGPQGKGWKK